MENRKDNLPLEGTKKELYDRLKTTMQKEAQEGVVARTRRGFLSTLFTGGAAVLGFGAATVVRQQAMAGCAGCENPENGCGECYCNCQADCEAGCLNSCLGGCEGGCQECQSCVECQDCVECQSCVECQNCVECQSCQDCQESCLANMCVAGCIVPTTWLAR
jgi:hypothetical protein